MKALKLVGFIILGIVLLIVVLSLIAPKSYQMEKSIVVKADEATVFKAINQWSEFQAWSPWSPLDPNMEINISENDGSVGSTYSWKGNDSVGEGIMTRTEVVPNQKSVADLVFKVPYESKANTWMNMEPAEGGYKVTWGMKGDMAMPMNIMMLFMDFTEAIGKDYDKGLNNLKTRVEAQSTSFQAQPVEMPAMKLLYIRSEMSLANTSEIMKKSYSELFRFVQAAGLQATGAPLAFYESFSPEKSVVAMAVPVAQLPEKLEGAIKSMERPQTYALVATYKGAYENMMPFYESFDAYVKANAHTINGAVVEEYITDPELEKDTTKWITKVYYPIVQPAN